MDTTKMWDYRVVRREEHHPSDDNSIAGSDEWYSIQEVYYDEDGTPMAQTMDLMVEQDTVAGMRTQLESMLRALDNPVLDESDIVDNPVNTKTMEDRVLSLEIENAEMRDRLNNLGEEITSKTEYLDGINIEKSESVRKVEERVRKNTDKLRGL